MYKKVVYKNFKYLW